MFTSPQQLIDELNKLPNKIRTQELLVVEAENKLDEAKLEFDVEFGMFLVASSRPNATEKKSEAVGFSKNSAKKLLEAKYNLKKEQAGLNYVENRFISLRKIASLEEKLINSNLSGR